MDHSRSVPNSVLFTHAPAPGTITVSARSGAPALTVSPVTALRTSRLTTVLSTILADPQGARLTGGLAAAMELGLDALEHLEGAPAEQDVRALVAYAARHAEPDPARDALLAVLLNASGTLVPPLAAVAREEVRRADWGKGRESAGLVADPAVAAVPRRRALAERLMAERARRLRPEMNALVAQIVVRGVDAGPVPRHFLERNWMELRDTLVQRVRNEPMHREQIAAWVAARPAELQAHFAPVADALVDAAVQAILHTPQRAPLRPYCGDDRVAAGVRTAVTFRGDPARARLTGYLARLTPGTAWHETIRGIVGG
jgi:hypothetical protein